MNFKILQKNVSTYADTVRDKISTLKSSTTILSDRIADNIAEIVALHSDVSTLYQYVDSEIDDAKSQIDSSLSAVISEFHNDFISHVTNYNAHVATNATSFAQLHDADDNINSSISAIKNDISALDSSVNSYVVTHKAEYDALVAADEEIYDSISAIHSACANALEDLKTQLESLN